MLNFKCNIQLIINSAILLMSLLVNTVNAQNIEGEWVNCPGAGISGATRVEPRFGQDGTLYCIYTGGNLSGPTSRPIKSGFTACLTDNTKYVTTRSSYRAFCTKQVDPIALTRSAYTWTSDKTLWAEHQIVRDGYLYSTRENYKFTPCRVRINGEYFFGYLLPQNGATRCMFIHKSGNVLPSGDVYDLMVLTKDYGIPTSNLMSYRGYDALELFYYPGIQPRDRQVLCTVSYQTGWPPRYIVELPGILLNGKCISHWAGQIVEHNGTSMSKIGLR